MSASATTGPPPIDIRCAGLSLARLVQVGGSLPLFGKQKETYYIFRNVCGTFEPGSMTLILGQPGSGKSSLIKALGGRSSSVPAAFFEGELSYNGALPGMIRRVLPRHVAYVTQDDIHFPKLTVRETLEFAKDCCGDEFSAHGDLLTSRQVPTGTSPDPKITSLLNEKRTDHMIQQLGLVGCQDTVVGDVMTRGVSGGERKRVTMGEMLYGDKQIVLLDEITTGLDSAIAYDIVSSQRRMAKERHKTVVMSLLQPSPEIFGLFDNVIVLNAGEVLYFGPCREVVEYFASVGYACPPDRNVADFLVDLGTTKQDQYQTIPLPVDNIVPTTASEFATAFTHSMVHRAMVANVQTVTEEQEREATQCIVGSRSEFHQAFWASTWTLLKRQITLSVRDRVYLLGRLLAVMVVGLLYGTLFYQFEPTDITVVVGVTFTVTLFLAAKQAAENPMFMEARAMFYKQRDANFYRTSSFLLAYSVSQVPSALVETLVSGSIIYWACGFVPSAGNFLLFELFLLITSLALSSTFFLVAAISPNIQVAEPMGMLLALVYVIFGGAMITKSFIPDYLIWVFWLNPLAWVFRSLIVLQYRHESFDVCDYGGIDYCVAYGKTMGEYYLSSYDIPSEKYWVWLGLGFLVLSYAVFMGLVYLALEFKRFGEQGTNFKATLNDEKPGDQPRSIGNCTPESYGFISTPRFHHDSTNVLLDIPVDHRLQGARPVALAFMDIWYSVPDPNNKKQNIDLLKGVSGYAMPHTITALMGASGAGKTTLMDVIAGRKTGGTMTGQVLLNGYPATDLAIRRSTGYCEQMDVHSETATFREALLFSAFLRQGSDVSDEVKRNWVSECIDLLELASIADNIIRGSSREQLKRLTIGVELAARPSVLFLDEPTSGLDARAAKHIMEGVRKVADTGVTVVCTIHQPSPEVFGVFDKLLLLKRGGEMVFFGDLKNGAREMIEYFESIAGVRRFEEGMNPAAWMLDVIGASIIEPLNESSPDFAARFSQSELRKRLASELRLERVGTPALSAPALEYSSKRAASEVTQMHMLMNRFFRMHWRDSDYNIVRWAVSVILAALFALIFNDAQYKSYQNINSGIGMLYLSSIFVGIVSFDSVLPFTIADRGAFYRERASRTYNVVWYWLASTVAEIPYVLLNTLLFTSIFFPSVGFAGVWRFLVFWLANTLAVLTQTYLGNLLAIVLPSIETAAAVGMLLIAIFVVHMGFNPPASTLPAGYKLIYHITPQKYILSILSAVVFADCSSEDGDEIGCRVLENAPPTLPPNVTVKEFVKSVYWMKYDEVWSNMIVVLLIIVVLRVLALIGLRFVNYQTK